MMTDGQLLEAFLDRGDESAFRALVRRHGPMVLRVCRDVLEDDHAAEDAFQATFLVLVRRAGSIRDGDSLGRWLHGVATRVAVRSRVQARRRRARERVGVEVGAMARPDPEPARHELRPVLHAEIDRLPAELRDAIVLCYLEGQTYEAAARRLLLPLGTLKGRLARGRELLRSRLARRGLAVTMLLLLLLLAEEAPALAEPLEESTVEAARRLASGESMAAVASDRVASLVRAATARRRGASVLLPVACVVLGLAGSAVAGWAAWAGVQPPSIPAAGISVDARDDAGASGACHATAALAPDRDVRPGRPPG